ncbi:MAG: MbnH family di-heme enzyme [Acidobacteriota bacterium]
MRLFLMLAVLGAAAAQGAAPPAPSAALPASRSAPPTFAWQLPRGLPVPRVPADNPISAAKVRLGRSLFYDKRLSGNGTFSCASCHQQAHAFTDARAHALGSTGQAHARSSMSLANVAYNASYGWADAGTRTLEAQMTVPMLNEHPIEMGLKGHEAEVVARLAEDPDDARLFRDAFAAEPEPVTLANVIRAIASFERTLMSANAPLDRYLYRDERDALGPAAVRGMQLFFSDRLACARCHSGFNLSGPTVHDGSPPVAPSFHNTGLYDVDGRGSYPASDRGLFDKTHLPADMGRFRAPTLRNIAVTPPYMHDGSVPTLEAAVAHYASGGVKSVFKSPRLKGFTLSGTETADLLAFLDSLTDQEFLSNSAFGQPPAR